MADNPRLIAPLIKRFEAGQPQISASNLNRMVDRLNSAASSSPLFRAEPKFVRTCRDAEGAYPSQADNPRKYPFRFVTVDLDESDPAGVAYRYSFPTPDGEEDKPDGEFVNLRPSNPTIALPYRAEDTFLWIWFGDGYFWSMEPELTSAICKTPTGGIGPMTGDTPGKAECEMYYINDSGVLTVVETISGEPVIVEVYNLGDEAAAGEVYIQAKREAGSGRWVGDWEQCSN